MNEEEKKAIIELNHYINITAYWKQEEYTNNEIDNYIKILLSLIKKQQKEFEELREVIEKDYISKDKIKEKIKELLGE